MLSTQKRQCLGYGHQKSIQGTALGRLFQKLTTRAYMTNNDHVLSSE